jgi:hypothetical protein
MSRTSYRRRDVGQEKKRILTRIASELTRLRVEDYQVRPALPDVLVQPDLLIVPRLGSLATVTIAHMPEPRKEWPFTLEKIEGLFELKLATGTDTGVSLVLLESDNTDFQERDAFQLLNRLFDRVYILPVRSQARYLRDFVSQLISFTAKEEFGYLWDMERRARQRNLRSIEDRPHTRRLLNHIDQTWQEESGSPSSANIAQLRNHVEQRLYEILDLGMRIQKRARVLNIKHHFLGPLIHYSFQFDFLIETYPGSIVQVIRGSSKAYGGAQRLRQLAVQPTFLRYRSRNGRLEWQTPSHSFNLVADGDLVGPEHSPKRYLRLLMAAGWNPIRLSDLSSETLDLEGQRYGEQF